MVMAMRQITAWARLRELLEIRLLSLLVMTIRLIKGQLPKQSPQVKISGQSSKSVAIEGFQHF